MTSRIVHYVLLGIGAAAGAVGLAAGLPWLSGVGLAFTALAGGSGTTFAPAVTQGDK